MWLRQVLTNWRDPHATEILRNIPGFTNQQVTTDDSLGGYTVPTPMAQSISTFAKRLVFADRWWISAP